MNLLLTLAVSGALVGSSGPIAAVQPDSAENPAFDLEDALALLQAEHHFSIPILLLEDPAAPTR
jgi:hypothetical protein